jgi:hypothetical protein
VPLSTHLVRVVASNAEMRAVVEVGRQTERGVPLPASGRRSSERDPGVMTLGLTGGIPWPGS